MITLIAAVADNGVIGSKNALPWRLRDDLKRFRELTTGHVIVMGRKTFESIGRPLPNRQNIVLSRQDIELDGVRVIHSLDSLDKNEEIFIIGGAEIYAQTINQADRLYITEVKADIDGDVHFPAIEPDKWREVSREPHPKDDDNEYATEFVVYEKI